MILAMDVGNTNIKFGLFSEKQLISSWRFKTDLDKTADEYGVQLTTFFNYNNQRQEDVSGVIISSVIPPINYTLEHMARFYFKCEPLFVGPGIKTGMNLKYDNPRELGADRIVNAIAALSYYGGPCITIDFGTATTFGAISKAGEFVGGTICPGLKIASEALVTSASKLPKVELIKPRTVINKSTVTCMQAGIIYGYVGLVEYIVRKMKKELGDENAPVIATGGLAHLIASESDAIDRINPVLTLEGLRIVYERNLEALGEEEK